jgi:hypothetical protein
MHSHTFHIFIFRFVSLPSCKKKKKRASQNGTRTIKKAFKKNNKLFNC